MPRLVEGLSRFFGRVEIFALGLESERQAAETALGRGQPLEARDHARAIVAALPDSPLGLALLADAAEDAWLDHEAANALSELSRKVPWRADVWLRLARAGRRIEWPYVREALERAATAPDERESARLALLDLADMDLAEGDPARAERWLDRIAAPLSGTDREVSLRRAECALARGDVAAARHAAEKGLAEEDVLSGREALVKARLALAEGQSAVALDLALRGFILETDGAGEVLAALLAGTRDVVVVDRVRRVVAAAKNLDDPMWAAAFAFAEGRRDDARRALSRGLGKGDRSAAAALLALATETRDLDALNALHARDPALVPAALAGIREAAVAAGEGREREALDRLDRIGGDLAGWAAEIRRSVFARWAPGATPAGASQATWPELLHELRRGARALDRLDLVSGVEALAVERERPLRVAVVGEFNAGKSTFLNALLGEDVAPTGVLPTTATLHWVAWAPDPFARVVVKDAPDRVVPHAELKATLTALRDEGARVSRVYIYAPIERLKRVEILDTPGFNAPDPDHVIAARQAFDEAHLAIWLLDATHAMKESERKVLAEIHGLGVPVQILVNKADRLKAEERRTVLDHVHESLAAVGLASHAEPVAFSARLSLKGRMGDAAALAASGWPEVEALIAERIVDASDALRERALRRRAKRIAEDIAAEAASRAAHDREDAAAARARRDAMLAAAARLRQERQALASAIDAAVASARTELASDLRPLGALPEERQRADAGLREYVRERFVARLSEPLVNELAKRAAARDGAPAGAALVPPRATAAVRAVLMGAVASHDAPAHLIDRPLDRVIEAALEAFAAALVAEADAPASEGPSAALELRASALRDAL
ncbi:Putative ATP /GTP binding protein [Minicystis rosea]|nr:Putative ATP /GTP binding protein [Minicystis rosea]